MRATVLTLVLLSLLPSSARAQSSGWEVEAAGGVSISRLPSSGDVTFPAPGATITTTSVLFPSRTVPSWFFGDGAALLNGVNAQFGVAPIVPLDAALGAVSLSSGAGPALGVRVRRHLSPAWSLEFGVDVMRGTAGISDDLAAAAETTRASFESAFTGLFNTTAFFTSRQVTATIEGPTGSSRDLAITGAVVRTFAPMGAFSPYVTLGGGVIASSGDSSLTLRGRYQFTVANVLPIDETDVLTVRAQQDKKLVALVGGGVRRDLTPRLALRLDARALIGGQGSRLLIDAAPDVAVGSPADFLESLTNPAIQFSSNPSTGRRSSLGEPGLDGFAVFSGSGVQVRVIASAGIAIKF